MSFLDKENIEEDHSKQEKSDSFLKSLRRDFFYGLIIILPTIATIGLVVFFVNLISGPISALFGQKIPLLVSFLLTVSLITITGIAARNFIGAAVLQFAEDLIDRVPIVNSIYRSTKQIVNAFSFKNKSLLGAVLIEYPKKGTWALGFITRNDAKGLITKDNKDMTEGKAAVFVPTTPNPTSGYLIYVDRKEIKDLDISVEDSIKVLMSAGVVSPGSDYDTFLKTQNTKK